MGLLERYNIQYWFSSLSLVIHGIAAEIHHKIKYNDWDFSVCISDSTMNLYCISSIKENFNSWYEENMFCFLSLLLYTEDMASYPYWSGIHASYSMRYHKACWWDVKLYSNRIAYCTYVGHDKFTIADNTCRFLAFEHGMKWKILFCRMQKMQNHGICR